VDSDTVEKLIPKDEEVPSKLSQEEQEKIKPWIEEAVDKERFHVVFESLSQDEMPMMITRPEFLRRMKDMSAIGGGMDYMGGLPDSFNLVVNSNHALVVDLLKTEDESVRKERISQMTDLALLSQQMLEGEDLTAFIERSLGMIR
jgi:molecular chaperone HtpG